MTFTLPKFASGQSARDEQIARRSKAAKEYYELAAARWRARDLEGFARFFRRAFAIRPTTRLLDFTDNSKACALEVRDRARALIDHGVAYAPVIAALAVAETRLGNDAATQYLMDYDRFVQQSAIVPPEGSSIEAFNRALASEIKTNLKYYDSPPDLAIRRAWRFEGFGRATTPALRELIRLLRVQATHYIDRIPEDAAHPFTASRPLEFGIDGWAVVSDGESHHEPHIHPKAWATGVYYVVQPDVSRAPGSDRGWLHIGPPRLLEETDAPAWTRRMIEPAEGSLVLMPGYFWHATQPMGVDQERICVAFEIRPLELK